MMRHPWDRSGVNPTRSREIAARGGESLVAKVIVKEGEPFEKALKRFKKKV
jgi:hypothetical protein